MNAVTTTQAGGFAIEGMTGAMHLAKAMSSAKMVPNHLQGSPGDCLMVIEQAMRWQMSPFAVAQATAVVRGKMCFEGKLVAAAIQTSGVLEGRLNYEFEGDGQGRKVICSGLIRGEKKPRTVEVLLKDAKTDNQWWTKTPDQMLSYHSARVWARRHTPEVMLGVYAPEEFDTPSGHVVDVTPDTQQEPRQQIQEERPVDYVEFFTNRLKACADTGCVLALEKKWEQTQNKARDAGKVIAPEVLADVTDLFADRYGFLHEQERQRDAANAEVPAEEMPA
ncbi:recombinase RecT [Gluconobacter sphaericus]|uniref:recombinase RecT n=1 Tax=Gluconobacter sphaericus TaxID=574987 RepID=UPI001B8BA9C7|nr:recombinase RecT [Gluconobacter sphaericus]MBS1096368.1 recombinase RecT [Gluconobacter sphaericus]